MSRGKMKKVGKRTKQHEKGRFLMSDRDVCKVDLVQRTYDDPMKLSEVRDQLVFSHREFIVVDCIFCFYICSNGLRQFTVPRLAQKSSNHFAHIDDSTLHNIPGTNATVRWPSP